MKRKKLLIGLSIAFALTLILTLKSNSKSLKKIDKILETESYSYLSPAAKDYVKEVYKKTGKIILTEKNKEVNKTYLNPQFAEYLSYSDDEKAKQGEIPVSMVIDYQTMDGSENIDVPSRYDMRGSYITPVRDQGKLGVCWTFATAETAESYLLKNDSEVTIDSPVIISERQIDYITARNGIKDYRSEYDSFIMRDLGDGGNFYISTIAMANGVSLFNANSFKPYQDRDLSKMELSDVISYDKSDYEVNSTINMPRIDLRESTSLLTDKEKTTRDSYIKEVKKNIIEKGGAYVGTDMSSSCQYNDSNLNNLVIDVYHCMGGGGHAMQIIGWDDDLEYSYCADTTFHNADTTNCKDVVSGKGVWILRNSWGDESQYPYLTYDSLYSSIHFIDDMTKTDDRSWDNNYVLGNEENISEKTYYLTDTRINGNEKIEKIKFITETPNTEYNVKVYKKSGDYKTYSKTTELPGLITIDITDDIEVDKNTKIIISSEGEYIDKVSVFTSNIDTTSFVDLGKYNDKEYSENQIRLYSETKNIPSGSTMTYKMYSPENQEINDKVSFSNNVVAENNINTSISFSSDLDSGDYRIDAIYDSNVVSSTNIKIAKMQGLGTQENPYIITNSAQLNQIRNDLDGYYELANDIDLTEDTHEGGKLSLESEICPQGFGWESINDFSGTLDGKGHKIKGLYQNNFISCNEEKQPWYEWYNMGNGLFGTTSGNVTIKNLILEDFDVNCQGDECAALVSKYNDYTEEHTEYTATFENIALINSKVRNSRHSTNTYSGGLFGSLMSSYGNISISNIYLDYKLETEAMSHSAYLIGSLRGNNVNIQNIQAKGNIIGKYSDGANDAVLIYDIMGVDSSNSMSTKNILSTVTGKNVGGILYNSGGVNINNVNALAIEDRNLCGGDCSDATNVNIFNKDTELYKLTDASYYSTWDNFDDNWVIETIDGIPRIPVLKFVDFEYTNINDISIDQRLNEKYSIYDYIEPNIDSAKRISYRSNNDDIVTIDENGFIIPQSTGNTTIHIESYYDGYINDVPISITYKPHYNVHFDANGGTGTMDSVEIETGKEYKLPENRFMKEYYEFKEWNTKPDGTGISYADLDTIPAMEDKESITLYAIWWGEERIVTFDADGGIVDPDKKVVRIKELYGELPIPIRSGYGFIMWAGNTFSIDAFDELSERYLKAIWVTDAYTIIYDANGGTIQPDYKKTSSVYLISDSLATTYSRNGEEKEIFENLYEKPGYKFKEWNTKPDGTGTSYAVNQTIQLSNVEDDVLRLYAIWDEVFTYKINEYEHDEILKQIDNIDINTELDTFKSNIMLNDGYSVEVDYKTIGNKKVLYTGGKTKIYENNNLIIEYTNIVKGDVTGTGTSTVSDVAKLYQYLKGKITMDDFYVKAGNVVDSDDIIKVNDVAKLYQFIKGKIGDL